MRHYLPLLLCMLLFAAGPAVAASPGEQAGEAKNCRKHDMKTECDAACTPEMRGRCGKRLGDWYGARQPVTSAAEARALLMNYFSGQGFTVSEVIEKRWGFRAEILDKDGTVVDRVMIDKRSGRIRSLN